MAGGVGLEMLKAKFAPLTLPLYYLIPNTAIANRESMTFMSSADSTPEMDSFLLSVFRELGDLCKLPEIIELKKKYLTSEHSPIRYLRFIIRMEIPYCNSVHFVRHKLGVEHFVQSQRNDRQDIGQDSAQAEAHAPQPLKNIA